MNAFITPDVKISGDSSLAKYFSAEPEKQKVELLFLQRYIRAKEVESAKELRAAAKITPETRFSTAYDKMLSSSFRAFSTLLEKTVPEETGFGKFHGKD